MSEPDGSSNDDPSEDQSGWFVGLPEDGIDLHNESGIRVRLPHEGDAEAVFSILADPDLRFIVSRPSRVEEVTQWIRHQAGHAAEALLERSVLLVIEAGASVVGVVTAQMMLEESGLRLGADEVPTLEYTAYRAPAVSGQGVVRQAVTMIEPMIVERYGIQQVVASAHEKNEEAHRALASFGDPVRFNDIGYGFYVRTPMGPAGAISAAG